jgi:uncharacterized repeat protein (TIGR01451 family)
MYWGFLMRFTKGRCGSLLLAVAFGLTGGGAWAQSAQVTSQLQVERVESVDGKTVLKPAQVSKPGDVLEYRITYTNQTTSAVSHLVADLPIPAGTTLIAGSELPAEALASTDGVNFAPLPLTRMERQADGSERKVAVPIEQYRMLRWNLGTLGAGKSAQAQARMRVNDTLPTAAPAPARP